MEPLLSLILPLILPLTLPVLTALTPQVLDVRGTTRCPSATDVLDRLGALLSAEAVPVPTDWLELRDVPSRAPEKADLEMRLNRAGLSTPLSVRRLPRAPSCAETVDSVAVIAASWIATFPTPIPPAPPIPQTALVRSPIAEDKATDARSQPGGVSSSHRNEDGGAVTARAAPASPTTSSRFALGAAGGLVAGATGGSAASIQIEAEVAVGTHGLFRLTSTGTGNRDVGLGTGKVSWQRLAVFPTAMAVWRTTAATLEIGAGPLLALTRARGEGFPSDGSDTGPNVGAAPTARVGRRLGGLPVTLWLSATTNLWLRPPKVQVDSTLAGETATVSLPWWDATVAAGLTFPLGR